MPAHASGQQTEITLFRNAQDPIRCNPNAAEWMFPGSALSASTSVLHGRDLLRAGARIERARWVLVWNPSVQPGFFATGVRLILADFGPTNIVELARFQRDDTASPVVNAVDITYSLQDVIARGQTKVIAYQTHGNTVGGCLVYGSYIEVVWR